jgi:hypothetical protein
MSIRFYTRTIAFSLAVVTLFTACRKRADVSLPDNLVVFTSAQQGIPAAENSIIVKVQLTRPTDKDVEVRLRLTEENVGVSEYSTAPVVNVGGGADPNIMKLIIPSGNNEASFTVTKTPGVLFDGDEKLHFEINRSDAPVLIGAKKTFTLDFSEIVAPTGGFTITGGGATYGNKVFIDLSANRQTAVNRTNWDLGFYTEAGDANFRVILNSSVAMMAKQINKNDLNTVTAADTTGFSADVAYSPFAPAVTQMPYVDYPNGDLTKTAIALIPSTAADSKVYIINRGNGVGTPAPARGWKKIRILRNASGGYTLQHADIGATSFTSIDIPKDDAYFFKYVSFENGVLNIEPQKKKWDLAWTYFGFTTNFGGGEVPYMFQDFIIQNRNVQVAKILETSKAYNDFNEATLTDGTVALNWNTSQTSIGSDWRRTTPSPAQTYSDRYYIIKDGDGNYYKVKFTSLADGGQRGLPVIAFALVKKA